MSYVPKCTIQWINVDGDLTPDSNDAVAMVVCTDTENCSGKKHPICAEHLKRVKYFDNWVVLPLDQGDCNNGKQEPFTCINN